MGNVFEESLFSKQPKQFEKIDSLAKAFAANYCGSSIIRDSIFGMVSNYARIVFGDTQVSVQGR